MDIRICSIYRVVHTWVENEHEVGISFAGGLVPLSDVIIFAFLFYYREILFDLHIFANIHYVLESA